MGSGTRRIWAARLGGFALPLGVSFRPPPVRQLLTLSQSSASRFFWTRFLSLSSFLFLPPTTRHLLCTHSSHDLLLHRAPVSRRTGPHPTRGRQCRANPRPDLSNHQQEATYHGRRLTPFANPAHPIPPSHSSTSTSSTPASHPPSTTTRSRSRCTRTGHCRGHPLSNRPQRSTRHRRRHVQ